MVIPKERAKRLQAAAILEPSRGEMSPPKQMLSCSFEASSGESSMSSPSNTDSDDSVEVRVRSPLHPKLRGRYRVMPQEAVTVKVEESDGESRKRSREPVFLVPKKKFRYTYEQQEFKQEPEDEEEQKLSTTPAPVQGCSRHPAVVFECRHCLEAVSTRFGWPEHSLTTSPKAPTTPQTPSVPAELAQQRVPTRMAPFLDPVLAYQVLQRSSQLSLPLSLFPYSHRPAPTSHAVPFSNLVRCSPSPCSSGPDDSEAPLDLTQHRPGDGDGPSVAASRFSIDNILAGRTAGGDGGCLSSETMTSSAAASASGSRPPAPRSPAWHSSNIVSCPPVSERRELANERERLRVKHLTGAFKDLNNSIGGITSECVGSTSMKFTKVAVLRTASLYIGYLTHLLNEGSGHSEERVYDQMRDAIVDLMTSKCKKGREDEDDEIMEDRS